MESPPSGIGKIYIKGGVVSNNEARVRVRTDPSHEQGDWNMVFSPTHTPGQTARTREYLALRRLDPRALSELLAYNCVKRGARWLAQHAQPGWWQNCFMPGGSRYFIHTGWSGDCVISYAFMRDLRFPLHRGVEKNFKIFSYFSINNAEKLVRLGFDTPPPEGWQPFQRRYPGVVITTTLIDNAWNDWLSKQSRAAAIDSQLARMSFGLQEPGPFGRFWNRIRIAFNS